MRACSSHFISGPRPGRPSSWSRACSMPCRCWPALSAACCAKCFPGVISKREDAMPTPRIVVAAAALLLSVSAAPAQEKLKAVATFSILADLVKNVGGERIDVQALVGPNGDAHVYQPSPSDAKALADAKVI